MSNPTIPTATNPQHQTNETVEHDPVEEQRRDAIGEINEFDASKDERQWQTQKREAQEERDKKLLERLTLVKSRRAAYRSVALHYRDMPHAPFRWLCILLDIADPDLDNCFPLRRTLAATMKVPVGTVDWNLDWLAKHGWIKRHRFYDDLTGRRCSSGFQFLIPPGVLPPGVWPEKKQWKGPENFATRQKWGLRKGGGKARV